MTDKMTESQRARCNALIPMQRVGQVEDIAKVALFLCSDSASYMTGQTLHVNGGMYMP